MLELIKKQNQQAGILVSRTKGRWHASFFVFNQDRKLSILGEKALTAQEYQILLAQKDELKSRNIFLIVEEDISAKTYLLAGNSTISNQTSTLRLVPSPYFLNIFREAEFFSTQKTRGPNA